MYKLTFGPLLRQYVVVITVNLCILATGLGLVWPSPVLVKLRNGTETVLSRPLTDEEGSWIVSIGFLTGLPANFLAAYLVDQIGRKNSIILACLPKILVGFLFIYASEVWMLLIGRAILGVSDAFMFSILPMYASEVASKEVRGALGTIFQIICSLGVVTMLCMGPFISYVNLNIIYTCILIGTAMPIFFLPDSPCFLYSKGHNQKVLEVLTFLRGSEALAQEEIIEYSLVDKKDKVNKMSLFKNIVFLKSFGIVVVLSTGSQLVGFNSISFYLQTILESTQTSVKPEVASVVIGFIQLLSSVGTTCVTDKYGRKPILTTTLVFIALGMVGLGSFFKLQETGSINGVLNFVPIGSLIFVVFGYSAGLGSINWVLTAELFDDTSRGVGLCISSILSYMCIFLTTKYFALLTSVLGPAETYWLFSVNCVLLCLFIMFCIPETKGKSFTEIQKCLGAKDVVNEEKGDVKC